MRRKDREVTDLREIRGIIDKCKVCRLGLNDNNEVYIVPLNFGYITEENCLTLYFHCAKEGRKLDIIKKNKAAGFEMDCGHELIEGREACGYGYRYESIIGNGEAVIVDDADEKAAALAMIMRHQTGREFEINNKMTENITIIKLVSRSFTCKRHG